MFVANPEVLRCQSYQSRGMAEPSELSFPDGTWTHTDPVTAGIDPNRLDDVVAYAREHPSTVPRDFSNHEEVFGETVGPLPDEHGDPSGLVLHKGEIITEWGDLDSTELCFSVSKSVLSLVAGVAYDRGLIERVDDPVGDYVDDGGFDDPHNAAITWRHLLQNTSEWGGTLFGKHDRDDRRKKLNRELAEPGTFWEYNDVRVNRLALSLMRLFERELPAVLNEALMEPMGASSNWDWYGYETATVDVNGEELQSVSGGGHWGGGVHATGYDLARLGLLALARGQWDGRRLLSEEWFAHSLAPCRINHEYGFMWWLNTEQDLWPHLPAESFAALGYGSNIVWIDPTRDLVAVVRWFNTGDDNENRLDELGHRLTAAIDHGSH